MSILIKANEIQTRLELELEQVPSLSELNTEASFKLRLVRNAFTELNQRERLYSFPDKNEVITYFKEIKPLFFKEYIYYSRLVKWSSVISFKEKEDIILFYKDQLIKIEEEYAEDAPLYHYFISGESNLDLHYFIIDAHLRYDERKGKMLALQQLRLFIMTQLSDTPATPASFELRWAGNRTELVELLYALYCSGSFGKVPLTKIINSFGGILKLDLKNYPQYLQNVKVRKETSQTFFINSLSSVMQERLDKESR